LILLSWVSVARTQISDKLQDRLKKLQLQETARLAQRRVQEGTLASKRSRDAADGLLQRSLDRLSAKMGIVCHSNLLREGILRLKNTSGFTAECHPGAAALKIVSVAGRPVTATRVRLKNRETRWYRESKFFRPGEARELFCFTLDRV